ncbi:hypothetical protein ABGB17_38045 [Sphaerisporangium sp. B11E5]|uniref:hypothetical protein n=1 Tax=Sphaerisporangium sp. B11E5 TaxID=3153563 RepID=UPI00325E216B
MVNRVMVGALLGVIALLVVVIVVMRAGGDEEPVTSAGGTPSVSASTPVAGPSPAPATPWAEGDCVDVAVVPGGTVVSSSGGSAGDVRQVECGAAGARILLLVDRGDGEERCPRDTDGFVDTPTGLGEPRTACVRNLATPHPAERGRGGGVLVAGDCVLVSDDGDVKERSCTDSRGPGRVWGLYKKKSQCKDSRGFLDYHYAHRRPHPTHPVVCAGPGHTATELGAKYPDGTCFRKPPTLSTRLGDMIFGGLDEVACSSRSAWARVVASARVAEDCPARATNSVGDDAHYPGTTCLRTLR